LQVQADNARQDGAAVGQQLADSKAQLTRLMEQRRTAEQQVDTLATRVERSTKEASDAESRLADARNQLEQTAAEQRLLSARTARGPVSAEGVPAPSPASEHAPDPPQGVASAPAAAAPALAGDQASMQGSQASVAAPSVPARAVAPVETQTTLSPRRGVDARPVAPPAASSSAMLAETMVRRGDALLQRGDVSAARLLYERAAAAGSGRAATAMGKTFDPTFLAGIGVSDTGADPALATRWYRRAAGLGDEEARTRLQAPPSTARRTSTTSERRP
jgi:TPR repeat protein